MSEVSKQFNKSEIVTMKRSQIKPADYNPRTISAEQKKELKKSIRLYGVVGGMIVNKQTGFTLVGGHQKLLILDELNKYPDNDYTLRLEVVDIDEKTEKEMNLMLNNPNSQGDWDYDMLREMIPEIDYKNAGLSAEDLSLIGIDFEFQTETENYIADALDDLVVPIEEKREAEREIANTKKEEVKAMKQKIKDDAEDKAREMDSYVMVNFDSNKAKADFMERFGMHAMDKFVKGEYLIQLIDDMT